MKILDFEPKEIFIGQDDLFYLRTHTIQLSEGEDFKIGGYFKRSKNKLTKIKFESIGLKNVFFDKLDFIKFDKKYNRYDGYFGHTLRYEIITDQSKKYLVLLSDTEKQPGLYQIFAEAIVEFEKNEISE